jgi:hypothetical protein
VKIGPRERQLLLALGLALLLALGVRLWGLVRSGEEGLGSTSQPREAAFAEGTREVVPLDSAALKPHAQTIAIGRDPFRFGPEPTPPPTPPPPPAPTPYVLVGPVLPPPPKRPTPPNPDHLKFLGSFGPADNRIAVVLSGGEIYNVREGAVLEGKFIVQQIGFESVAIAFVGFPDEPPRRLPVGGPGGGNVNRAGNL